MEELQVDFPLIDFQLDYVDASCESIFNGRKAAIATNYYMKK